MKLIPDWKKVLLRAWSVKMLVLASIFSGLEVALPILEPVLGWPAGTFAAIAGVVSALGILLRVLSQSNLPEGA